MFYVYVLRDNESGKFYIGRTEDLKRRIREHKVGHTHTTARYKEKNLIYFEGFISKKDALRRERYFKTSQGKKGLKLILRETLTED